MEVTMLEKSSCENLVPGASWEHEELAKVKVKVFRGHKKGINFCSFVKYDQLFLSASDDGTARLWDKEKGIQVHSFDGHTDKVSCVKSFKDNNRVFSTGWDKKLICWDMAVGRQIWSRVLGGISTSCDVSMDGKYLVSGNDLDHAVCIWDLKEGKQIMRMNYHKGTVTSCCFSPIQYRFCTSSMDLTSRIVDMRNYVGDLDPHCVLKMGGHRNMISCSTFSGDERRLATGSWDKNLQLWDINSGAYRSTGPVTLSKGHEGSVSGCKLSNDGSLLISSSYDETLVIWDVDNSCKKIALQGHTGWVTCCDLSKDAIWALSSSKDRTLRLWNLEQSDEIPIVLQNKKNIGLKLLVCQDCGKSFSIAEAQDPESVKYCVFCRLQRPATVYLFEDGTEGFYDD